MDCLTWPTARATRTRSRSLPDTTYDVRVQLKRHRHSFPAGHSLRLAIPTGYWPLVWPTPEPVTLTLHAGASTLELPLRPPRGEDAGLRPFEEPTSAPPLPELELREAGATRLIEHDLATLETTYTTTMDIDEDGRVALTRIEAIDLDVGHGVIERFRIRDGDPLSAAAEIEHRTITRRAGWSISVKTLTSLVATGDAFELRAELEACEGETTVFSHEWHGSIPRELV